MYPRKPPKQPEALISLLFDAMAEFGDRDDAAMDLAQYNEPEVEQALAQVASDPGIDADLAERCGESLAEIWRRKGRVDFDVLSRLQGPALEIALSLIQLRKPEWENTIK